MISIPSIRKVGFFFGFVLFWVGQVPSFCSPTHIIYLLLYLAAFRKKKRLIYFMCMGVSLAFMYLCHMHAWCLGMLEEVMNLLHLELWMVMKHIVGVENRTWVFCKSKGCSWLWNNLFSLLIAFWSLHFMPLITLCIQLLEIGYQHFPTYYVHVLKLGINTSLNMECLCQALGE